MKPIILLPERSPTLYLQHGDSASFEINKKKTVFIPSILRLNKTQTNRHRLRDEKRNLLNPPRAISPAPSPPFPAAGPGAGQARGWLRPGGGGGGGPGPGPGPGMAGRLLLVALLVALLAAAERELRFKPPPPPPGEAPVRLFTEPELARYDGQQVGEAGGAARGQGAAAGRGLCPGGSGGAGLGRAELGSAPCGPAAAVHGPAFFQEMNQLLTKNTPHVQQPAERQGLVKQSRCQQVRSACLCVYLALP